MSLFLIFSMYLSFKKAFLIILLFIFCAYILLPLIEIYLDFNGCIVLYMVNRVCRHWHLTVRVEFFHVLKDDLPCGRKRLNTYKTKVDQLQDEQQKSKLFITLQLQLTCNTWHYTLSRKQTSLAYQHRLFKHLWKSLRAFISLCLSLCILSVVSLVFCARVFLLFIYECFV